MTRRNESMYGMYEDYENTLKNAKKVLRKRQKINREIREKYDEPFKRDDHVENTKDITIWNEIIRDKLRDMKCIEGYLEFDDRHYLHKEYFDMKSMIYNQNSYEGVIPFDALGGDRIPDVLDIVCDVELQDEIVNLLDEVLTDRQREVVQMYFFDNMTQERIGEKLGISREAIKLYLANSLEKLRNCVNLADIGQI